jgi:hypothetical protein
MAIKILPKHVQESLVTMYLRLNGFFTSGHIIHASSENAAVREIGDIDVLAIRLPFSQERETDVPPSHYLNIENGILEIIIGEVKSGREPIQFNQSIREPSNVIRVLRRAGFTENEGTLLNIAQSLSSEMVPQQINHYENRIEELIVPSGDILYTTRIRPIIFHLGRRRPVSNQTWFVGSDEIMNDIWHRLRPEFQPETCQREYDYHLWGPVFDAIAAYIKDETRNGPGTPVELVRRLTS